MIQFVVRTHDILESMPPEYRRSRFYGTIDQDLSYIDADTEKTCKRRVKGIR